MLLERTVAEVQQQPREVLAQPVLSGTLEWQRLCHGTAGFREERGIKVFREDSAMVM